jgi:AcrR family transcriptional regulator
MAKAAPKTTSARPDKAGPKGASSGGDVSRRDHIVGLAAQLFAEKGVTTTTVRDIGNAAGILSGSLYYHFDSKESIVKEIVRQYLHSLIENYEAVLAQHDEPRARLEGLIRASFEAIDRDHHACEIFQNDFKTLQTLQDFDDLDKLTGRVQKLWMTTIEEGVASGTFRKDVDPRLFYRFARDAIWFTVRWRLPGGPDTVARLSDAGIKILIDGFAADGST